MNVFSLSKFIAFSRYLFLFLILWQLPAHAAPSYKKLTLGGPAAVVSYPLLHMLETNVLQDYTETLSFRLWQSPDQLRALLTRKEIDLTAAPVNLPALMFNLGEKVKLLNISVWGILWLVSSDPDVKGFDDLKGKELLVPFQRDLPSVLLDTLLAARNNGQETVKLRPVRDAQDAITLMLSGKGQHALLVEPTAAMLLWRNRQQGERELFRVQSLEEAWRETFPNKAELPQAGLMANSNVAQDTELLEAVDKAYAESARWCKSNTLACAEMVNRHIPHLPVPAVEEAIRVTRLESLSASQIRPQLENLYGLLGERFPKAVGNKMPAVEFYGP